MTTTTTPPTDLELAACAPEDDAYVPTVDFLSVLCCCACLRIAVWIDDWKMAFNAATSSRGGNVSMNPEVPSSSVISRRRISPGCEEDGVHPIQWDTIKGCGV